MGVAIAGWMCSVSGHKLPRQQLTRYRSRQANSTLLVSFRIVTFKYTMPTERKKNLTALWQRNRLRHKHTLVVPFFGFKF